MAPHSTGFHHKADTAQDRRQKRYTRTLISDLLILFPEDQISSIQTRYKATLLDSTTAPKSNLLIG